MGMDPPDGKGIELDLMDLPDLPELRGEAICGADGSREAVPDILAYLQKEMRSGDFLCSFALQIIEINKVIEKKYASSRDIADVLLKDAAVVTKILSIVNSAYYGHFGEKGISSIAEAMVILGTEVIQQTAAALLLFEFMQDIGKRDRMKERALASLMRGMMGKRIAELAHYEELEVFQMVCMLHDIGEQVVLFCRPEMYHRIETAAAAEKQEKDRVAQRMMGISFSEIGRSIASGWGFPESIVEGLYPFSDFDMKRTRLSSRELKRLIATLTYEMCSLDCRWHVRLRKKKTEGIVQRYGRFIALEQEDAEAFFDHALKQIEEHARILKISLKNTRFDREFGGRPGGG